MRFHGVNNNGEEMTSSYVDHDPDTFGIACNPREGLTRQEFAEECDINFLMKRYEVTGQLPGSSGGQPQYLDVSDVPDLATAMRVVDEARTAFMSLPASVRATFDNDPVQFVEFAGDPENLDQMRKWGLAPPEKAPEPPMKVEVINPAPPEKAP